MFDSDNVSTAFCKLDQKRQEHHEPMLSRSWVERSKEELTLARLAFAQPGLPRRKSANTSRHRLLRRSGPTDVARIRTDGYWLPRKAKATAVRPSPLTGSTS